MKAELIECEGMYYIRRPVWLGLLGYQYLNVCEWLPKGDYDFWWSECYKHQAKLSDEQKALQRWNKYKASSIKLECHKVRDLS